MSESNEAMEESAPAYAAATQPTRRLYAVKAVFTGEYNGARGALLVVVDAQTEKLDRVTVIIANDTSEFRFPVHQEWRGFEGALISAKLQGQIVHQMSLDVQTYLKRALQEDAGLLLLDALKGGLTVDVRKVLSDIISKAIADAEVLMETNVETFDSVEQNADETTAVAPPTEGATAEAAPPAPAPGIRIKCEPILSPVSGLAAKDVLPGMTIFVEIKDTDAVKQNVARLLTNRAGGADKGRILARVTEVSAIEFDRILITCMLAPSVMGVCSVSGALLLKVPSETMNFSAAKASRGPLTVTSIPANVFLYAAIAVFTFMLVLAYLIFGGVI